MTVTAWPEGLPTHTAEEWRQMGSEEGWNVIANREVFAAAFKALKAPPMEYARQKSPGRAEILIRIQEELIPGSTVPAKAKAAPAAAPAAATKKAAPKAAPAAAETPASPAGVGKVDLGPVLAKLEEHGAQLAALVSTVETVETILKLLLLNPSNIDSLQLAADENTFEGIKGSTLEQLAAPGNG